MREYSVLGIRFVEDPNAIMLSAITMRGSARRMSMEIPPDGTSIGIEHIASWRSFFLAENGEDVDLINCHPRLFDRMEGALRRQHLHETAAHAVQAAPAEPRPAERNYDSWPERNGEVYFMRGEPIVGSIAFNHESRVVGGHIPHDMVSLTIPKLKIAWSRVRDVGETHENSLKKCRLELFKWLQAQLRDEFQRHKDEFPDVVSDEAGVIEDDLADAGWPEPSGVVNNWISYRGMAIAPP